MKPKPLVVVNIVGLTSALLGEHTPRLNALIADGFMAEWEHSPFVGFLSGHDS